MSHLTMRTATLADIPRLSQFIQELAVFEKVPHEFVATKETLRESLFDNNGRLVNNLKVYMCEARSEVVGYALAFFNFSTFVGKKGLYLEDLYISPEFRGNGYGSAALSFLAQVALESDCARFEWAVLDWNKDAIRLYEFLGAKPLSDWTTYRMSLNEIKALAKS